MTTSRRSTRRLGALVVTAAVAALVLGGCTPSDLELEARTTKSAFKALTGRAASGDVTCSLDLVSQDPGIGDRYEGSCVVHGRSFRTMAVYQMSSSYSTGWVTTAYPLGGGKVRSHHCLFVKQGSSGWRLNSPCRTGDLPGS